jgi:glycerol-3-phosphate acyltransferase PlsX
MRIIVDAMGGDNAPDEIVKGCLEAVRRTDGFELELIGDQKQIAALLEGEQFPKARIHVTHAAEVITNDDKPTEAIKAKKQSSMVLGLRRIKAREADAFVSAGSTGALLVGSLLIAGRLVGVNRPALAPLVPSKGCGTMLIDAGMNTQMKPLNYLQFAIMGHTYMKAVQGIESPRIGLVNVGTEDGKGHPVVQEAFSLLQASGLNFVGNIEGRDIAAGRVDVAVCDGFTGNAMLKMMEGTGRFFMDHLKRIFMRNLWTRLAAAIVHRDLGEMKRKVDPEEIGGTPILGVNGIVYKCHGNARAKAVTNTILKVNDDARHQIVSRLQQAFHDKEDSR